MEGRNAGRLNRPRRQFPSRKSRHYSCLPSEKYDWWVLIRFWNPHQAYTILTPKRTSARSRQTQFPQAAESVAPLKQAAFDSRQEVKTSSAAHRWSRVAPELWATNQSLSSSHHSDPPHPEFSTYLLK